MEQARNREIAIKLLRLTNEVLIEAEKLTHQRLDQDDDDALALEHIEVAERVELIPKRTSDRIKSLTKLILAFQSLLIDSCFPSNISPPVRFLTDHQLAQCGPIVLLLKRIRNLLVSADLHTENYFGSYNIDIVNIELRWLTLFLANYLDYIQDVGSKSDSNNAVTPPISPSRSQFASQMQPSTSSSSPSSSSPSSPYQFSIDSLQDVMNITTIDIGLIVFWLRHFGSLSVLSVHWKSFEMAFKSTYGTQIRHIMERFYCFLVDGDANRSVRDNGHHVVEDGMMVSVSQLQQIMIKTKAEFGIFDAVQRAVDPFTLVFVSGIVEGVDVSAAMNQNHRSGNHPRLLRSLLGTGISHIACGGQHVAILTFYGEIYTFGKNSYGQCGCESREGRSVNVPTRVSDLDGIRIESVACGFAYTAARDSNGTLFTWGAGENGRLGHGDTQSYCRPKVVVGLRDHKVIQCAAGSLHTCVLTDLGCVFTFGKAEYAGHSSTEDVLSPQQIDFGEPVKQVTVGPGGYHTIVLTVSKKVYSWGHNRVGQLGIDSHAIDLSRSNNNNLMRRNAEGTSIYTLPMLINVAMADNGVSSPTPLSDAGTDAASTEPAPTIPKDLNQEGCSVSKVYAGWGHSAIVYEDGTVKTCGRNVCGQLGIGEPNAAKCRINERGHQFSPIFTKVEGLDGRKVSSCALGGEHTLFVLDDDTVFGVGSNRNGQLGIETPLGEEKIFTPLVLNWVKHSRRKVLQISCGNDFSFFLTTNPVVPSLFKIAAEAIKNDEHLLESLRYACSSSTTTSVANNDESNIISDIISDLINQIEGSNERSENDSNHWLLDYVMKC